MGGAGAPAHRRRRGDGAGLEALRRPAARTARCPSSRGPRGGAERPAGRGVVVFTSRLVRGSRGEKGGGGRDEVQLFRMVLAPRLLEKNLFEEAAVSEG